MESLVNTANRLASSTAKYAAKKSHWLKLSQWLGSGHNWRESRG